MEINSTGFLLFFIVVFLVYYIPLKNSAKGQNLWLLLCSYISLAIIDWRVLPLLIGATCLFYGLGLWIDRYNHRNERKAEWLTTAGVIAGVGILVYFKYLGFLVEASMQFLQHLGWQVSPLTLNIMMPVGVSFFTFKLISYIVEIHRCHMPPCRDFVAFATYIAFFPTFLSGPIDRPKPFLSQLQTERSFTYPSVENQAVDGLRQILWGLFKKVVVADSFLRFIELGWSKTDECTPMALLLVFLIYPVQLYADFSGYTDMAIGVGKMLGIHVAKNFNYPFFAQNMADYWRRWHMSLTSWLTDYVFMPLNIRFRDWDHAGIILACMINDASDLSACRWRTADFPCRLHHKPVALHPQPRLWSLPALRCLFGCESVPRGDLPFHPPHVDGRMGGDAQKEGIRPATIHRMENVGALHGLYGTCAALSTEGWRCPPVHLCTVLRHEAFSTEIIFILTPLAHSVSPCGDIRGESSQHLPRQAPMDAETCSHGGDAGLGT